MLEWRSFVHKLHSSAEFLRSLSLCVVSCTCWILTVSVVEHQRISAFHGQWCDCSALAIIYLRFIHRWMSPLDLVANCFDWKYRMQCFTDKKSRTLTIPSTIKTFVTTKLMLKLWFSGHGCKKAMMLLNLVSDYVSLVALGVLNPGKFLALPKLRFPLDSIVCLQLLLCDCIILRRFVSFEQLKFIC